MDEVFAQLSGGPTGVYDGALTRARHGTRSRIAVSGRFAKVAELPESANPMLSNTWIARRAGMPRGFRCALAMRQQGAPSKASHIALPPQQRRAELIPMASFFHADCELRAASRELANTRSPTNLSFPVDQSK